MHITPNLSLAAKVILIAMGANVCLMGLIAKHRQSHSEGGKKSGSYIQLVSAHLPHRWKIWFVVSSLVGSVLIVILSLRTGF